MNLIRPLLFTLLLCSIATAAQALPDAFDPDRHMSIDQVKPGMKGYGLSVFHGVRIEKFDVEVISVLHNFNPQADVFLIRCAGQNLEHTGPISGMSGSPIYLYDATGKARMAGAFAYGWGFQKDPIAGVQPIQYMLDLPATRLPDAATQPTTTPESATTPGSATAPSSAMRGPVRWNLSDVVPLPGTDGVPDTYPFAAWNSLTVNPRLGTPDPNAMRLRPLITPLMSSGAPSHLLQQLTPLFNAMGMHPLQAGGGSSATTRPDPDQPPVKLEPGSVLAVPLLTGDMDLTAVGTTTEVLGDSVYGFGHSFTNEGPVAWPMGAGRVDAIIANLISSFKLGTMTHASGTLRTDAMVGITGELGQVPPTVPIDLELIYTDGSFKRHYHFDAATHPRFTPLLTAFALMAATSSARDLPQYHTLDYDVTLQFDNEQTVRIHNTAVNSGAAELFFDMSLPMMSAADNPFERVLVTKVSGTMRVIPEAREATILSVNLPRLKYRPGEQVRGYVTYRPFRGAEMTLPIALTLPPDLDEGDYQLIISDWQRYLSDERSAEPFKFTAENIQQVFDVLHDVTGIRRNALYLRLLRKPDGVAIGRTAMPHLPSSRRQVLLESGRSNTTPFVSSMVKTLPTDLVMSGSAEFVIKIDKDAQVEVAGKLPRQPSKPRRPGLDESKPTEPKPSEPAEGKEPAPDQEPVAPSEPDAEG